MSKSCFIDLKSEKNRPLSNEELNVLGVTIDENLKWNSHLKKPYKIFMQHRRINDNKPDDLHKIIYHILFESHLIYGITL